MKLCTALQSSSYKWRLALSCNLHLGYHNHLVCPYSTLDEVFSIFHARPSTPGSSDIVSFLPSKRQFDKQTASPVSPQVGGTVFSHVFRTGFTPSFSADGDWCVNQRAFRSHLPTTQHSSSAAPLMPKYFLLKHVGKTPPAPPESS